MLVSSGRRGVVDRLLIPALAASVRGIDARSWLDAEALGAISALGVGRLRWHVAASDRAAALAVADRLAAPGRAALEVVDLQQAGFTLEIEARPRAVPSPVTLAAALAALVPRAALGSSDARPLAERLGSLTAYDGVPLLRPEARASLLVLRSREAAAADPAALEIEAVFLDGREARGAR